MIKHTFPSPSSLSSFVYTQSNSLSLKRQSLTLALLLPPSCWRCQQLLWAQFGAPRAAPICCIEGVRTAPMGKDFCAPRKHVTYQ